MDHPEIITSSVRWTLPLSLAVHGFVLFILVWGAMPRQLQAPVLRAITVDLVSPEQLAAMVAPTPEPEPESEEPPVPAQVTPIAPPVMPPPLDEMVRATDFFAADILADPDNAEVRDNFPMLAGSEQVVQLCNMEALEQLRLADANLVPDALVGYAFDDLSVSGHTLTAEGGAFRSQGRWFHLRYRCTVSPDVRAVAAFEYAIGDPVPESQWEEHFLNSDDDWLD